MRIPAKVRQLLIPAIRRFSKVELVTSTIKSMSRFTGPEIEMATELGQKLRGLNSPAILSVLTGIRKETYGQEGKEVWKNVVLKHVDLITEKMGCTKMQKLLNFIDRNTDRGSFGGITYYETKKRREIFGALVFHMSAERLQKIYPTKTERDEIIKYVYTILPSWFDIDHAPTTYFWEEAYRGAALILILTLDKDYKKAAEIIQENDCNEGVRLTIEGLLRIKAEEASKIISYLASSHSELLTKVRNKMEIIESGFYSYYFYYCLRYDCLSAYRKIVEDRIAELESPKKAEAAAND